MYFSIGYIVVIISAFYVLNMHAWYFTCEENNCVAGYKNKTDHLLCHPGEWAKTKHGGLEHFRRGILLGIYPNTRKMIGRLLHKHNLFRNQVASGKEVSLNMSMSMEGEYSSKTVPTFPKAACMREIIWDEELEYLAYEHASLCIFEHDKCHSTNRFPLAGQNLGWIASNEKQNAIDLIEIFMDAFYDEKNYIPNGTEFAQKYEKKYVAFSGHFCTLMLQQISRVGCAMSMCTRCLNKKNLTKPYCYYMACDYDHTIVRDTVMYHSTKAKHAGDKCMKIWGTGRSKEYPNLCANNGEYFNRRADYEWADDWYSKNRKPFK